MGQTTSNSIKVVYQKIMMLVTELEEDCTELNAMASKLDALTEELGCNVNCGWYGEGATAFVYKCNELKEKINTYSTTLSQIGDTITAKANAYRKAEMAAIGIIEATWTSSDGTVSYSSGGSSGGGTR